MGSQHHNKKEGTIKDLFSKTPAKKLDPLQGRLLDSNGVDCRGCPAEDTTPKTKASVEQLFSVLRQDFATLKQKIAADGKDLIREVTELGQQINTVECTHDAQKEEIDQNRREILALQDSNHDLQYSLEDLENRSQCSNICIREVPLQVTIGKLEDFVIRLFHQVAPDLKDQDILLDCTYRAGRPAQSSGQTQDILMCLHYYHQQERILAAARDLNAIEFEGHRLFLFQDLSPLTVQQRYALCPVTDILGEKGTCYKWGHPFFL
ncbi:hypothetical protein NDU88_010130 [Pleurodeles waltl]|uniref:Uncharacterized protein n=1 Tax=Pleurodeles waltl TaxID=8319 RepID=A0AAV7S0D5_PLEWA|nr:hypothetical protein NDU88_010130 [Pleurodeles waltl]